MLLGMHFNSIDVGSRLLGKFFRFSVVYRPNDNPLLDHLITKGRGTWVNHSVDRNDIRQTVRLLRQGEVVWYAPDQDYGTAHAVFVPFFGVPAATITATSRIARMGKAKVIPCAHYRLPGGRYEIEFGAPLEDFPCGDDEADTARLTRYHREQARSIITHNQSPDLHFDSSINPYRGCEHGCIYCFARPNHAYVDLSPGQDFEAEIFCKDNAAEVLRDTLRKPGYRCRPLVIGTATDPYQPVERERLITREILQVLAECRHPFSLITKSALVLRDLDLIAPMAVEGRASVAVSVTTLDNRLKNQLEPRASGGRERLKTVRELARAGVPVTVLVAPLIPFINDQELEDIVEQVAAAGARSAGYVTLRLPHEVAAKRRRASSATQPCSARPSAAERVRSFRVHSCPRPPFYSLRRLRTNT